MPKGRIINSCAVDHQTVFMLIMETQVSKLTLSHTPQQKQPIQTKTVEDQKKHGKDAVRMITRKQRRTDGCELSGMTS
jgi:hypothetical protein